MSFVIEDWTGNRPFGNLAFDTFEGAWEYIYSHVDNSLFDKTQNEDDNVFQEYYVQEVNDD